MVIGGISQNIAHLCASAACQVVVFAEILHFQRDAELGTVHRGNRGHFHGLRIRRHLREVEVACLGKGGRQKRDLFLIHLQGRIVVIIPSQDCRIIIAVAAPVQIDSVGAVGKEGLGPVRCLRRNILPGIEVAQIIIAVRCACTGIVMFLEVPQHGIHLAAYPGNRIAGLVCLYQLSVIIHHIVIITMVGIVPDTGIENNHISVVHFSGGL